MGYVHVPVLVPGTYRLSDGQVKRYTSKDASHVIRQGNAQIKAGLSVPLSWMHDPEAEPHYLSNGINYHDDAWVARGYFADVIRYERGPHHTVHAVVKVYDENDEKQFKKVGRVSPCLMEDYVDERGVLWPGLSILHIASTPKPIQRSINRVQSYQTQCLSFSLRNHNKQSQLLSISIRSQYMADEKDKDTEVKAESNSGVAEAVELAAKAGFHLGDVKDWDEFLIAFRSSVATKMGDDLGEVEDDFDMDDDDDNAAIADETVAVSQPVMMSAATAKLANKLLKDHFDRQGQRVQEISKLMSEDGAKVLKDKHENEKKKYTSANLSVVVDKKFDEEGNIKKTELDETLDLLEQFKKANIVKPKANLSNTVVAPKPQEKKDDFDVQKERAYEIAKERGVDPSKVRIFE